ncbi:MAG: putative baseplate assembly protein [Anaerolineales bacterium]|nr:putative baseplate assembly protein [Anaerolineales bacterium]
MPLPLPNLDDRDFQQLVSESRQRIIQTCPEWTDLTPSDPGMVLLELFAHLTETMIYRLNRIPEKAYIAFLRLLGVTLHPPSAASVMLRFRRTEATDQPMIIPRGTRVTIGRTNSGDEPPVFVTIRSATIPAGESEVDVIAYHSELVIGELAGMGTSQPGLSIAVHRPPIVAPTGGEVDLVLGIEATPEELGERVPAIQHGDKSYRVWREVENFAGYGPGDSVYVVDRTTGVISFAPSVRMEDEEGELDEVPRALGGIPAEGREIRVWYLRGGGASGNLPANTLTLLKDPIQGVQVTNPDRATGGRAAEALENALARGPQDLHSLKRAVTAQDFENIAQYSSQAIGRAKAVTKAALWKYAEPGTVEVLLVPYLSEVEMEYGRVTASMLQARETEDLRSRIQTVLDERRPLGTICLVNWAHYKTVRVNARVAIVPEEDREAVRQRVVRRIYQTLNPLPIGINSTGWPFGQALRAFDIYDAVVKEPGVRWADRIQLIVEEVPDKSVAAISTDIFQPNTWYVGSGSSLFRSLNDGVGWESVRRFPEGQVIERTRVHPDVPGLLAVLTQPDSADESFIYISEDGGETWVEPPRHIDFHVEDAAWTLLDGAPKLLLATDRGLYEFVPESGAGPVEVMVRRGEGGQGFYAVAASTDVQGITIVAVAAQNTEGVFISSEGGEPGTFRNIGLVGEDIRVLAVQRVGARSYLWAGAAALGDQPGSGCFRWELLGRQDDPQGWQAFSVGWDGGSCRELAFLGSRVMAATHRSGVMRVDSARSDAAWESVDVNCGLPLRDRRRFNPVETVAADSETGIVMAGGSDGVFASNDIGLSYTSSSKQEFSDKVTIPGTWLFASGEHEITVVTVDEEKRD